MGYNDIVKESIEIDDKLIQKIIDDNYTILLGFDVADGNLSFKDYMKKITKRLVGEDKN